MIDTAELRELAQQYAKTLDETLLTHGAFKAFCAWIDAKQAKAAPVKK